MSDSIHWSKTSLAVQTGASKGGSESYTSVDQKYLIMCIGKNMR